MDIFRPKCGEPWEIDCLHELVDDGDAKDFHEARKLFQRKGCEAFGCSHNPIPLKTTALASSLMFDILGDDVDGIASMMDDFGYAGMLD